VERRQWPDSRPPAPRLARAARKDWLAPCATTGTDFATAASMHRTRLASRRTRTADRCTSGLLYSLFVRLATCRRYSLQLTAEVFCLDRSDGATRGTAARKMAEAVLSWSGLRSRIAMIDSLPWAQGVVRHRDRFETVALKMSAPAKTGRTSAATSGEQLNARRRRPAKTTHPTHYARLLPRRQHQPVRGRFLARRPPGSNCCDQPSGVRHLERAWAVIAQGPSYNASTLR
jgi:hypothetical protein